jgi:hypothetical protein
VIAPEAFDDPMRFTSATSLVAVRFIGSETFCTVIDPSDAVKFVAKSAA